MTPNRAQQISQAHSWLSENDIRLMLAYKYEKFSDHYEGATVQHLLDNYTKITSRLPESDLRDHLSRIKEFAVI
jgi:hypothetical protein